MKTFNYRGYQIQRHRVLGSMEPLWRVTKGGVRYATACSHSEARHSVNQLCDFFDELKTGEVVETNFSAAELVNL